MQLEKELKLMTEKKLKMLALLRGRHLRYEMKSKEVHQMLSRGQVRRASLILTHTRQIVLGRTAADSVVDVDLSEEGDAAKISRRQVPRPSLHSPRLARLAAVSPSTRWAH